MNEIILRRHGRYIIDHVLRTLRPENIISKKIQLQASDLTICDQGFHVNDYSKLCVVGAGKAGASMALGIETILGEKIHSGLVIVKEGHKLNTKIVDQIEAAHPVPDERSVAGCRKLINFVKKNNQPDTLFIFLLSGGASSLMAAPAQGISLADKQHVTRLLLACGADIHEINTVRKHLSEVKGGRLAQLMRPAQTVGLIISDIIGDNLEIIGSGPTAGDPSTWSDCIKVLRDYDLLAKVTRPVRDLIIKGDQGLIKDTPSPAAQCLRKVSNHIIASNRQALEAAADAARQLEYHPYILPVPVAGDTKKAAMKHTEIIKKILNHHDPVAPPCCIISGGETTVTLGEDSGFGGRNQEFALATVHALAGLDNLALFSIGTDGTDGPTDAAGAIVTGSTATRAKKMNLDPLHFLTQHDAYTFFDNLGDLIRTGPTLTNVMDLHIILVSCHMTNDANPRKRLSDPQDATKSA